MFNTISINLLITDLFHYMNDFKYLTIRLLIIICKLFDYLNNQPKSNPTKKNTTKILISIKTNFKNLIIDCQTVN